jgi:arsenate reductase
MIVCCRGAARLYPKGATPDLSPTPFEETTVTVTIYHNPGCGTSRNALTLLRESGIDPVVVEYLRDPPSRAQLQALIQDAGLTVREALRQRGTPYDELGLGDPALSDDQLLDAMLAHPILINRPFVVTPLGTRLCRPLDRLHEILPPRG